MKSTLTAVATASLFILRAQAAKEVFAHYIMGNAANAEVADWENDITLAQEASIDAFVLNLGFNDPNNPQSLQRAFEAAESKDFKLFFSFDYNALGPWPKDEVISLLNEFATSDAYFKTGEGDAQPLASTFEGPDSADDWPDIKAATSAFFIPDWSSISPSDAVSRADGVVDGLFSFNAWPNGATNITTDGDVEFQDTLAADNKAYMMPVSPWFFTNLPGLNKGWMWRGDNLWDQRWKQVLELQPEFVEILTWNDYGESHYIGPVQETPAKQLLETFDAPVDYVNGISHDGWRKHLSFYIKQYKDGAAAPAVAAGGAAEVSASGAVASGAVSAEASAVVSGAASVSAAPAVSAASAPAPSGFSIKKRQAASVSAAPAAEASASVAEVSASAVVLGVSASSAVSVSASAAASASASAAPAAGDLEESVVAYYRTNPATACDDGGITGNNADFPNQVEVSPDQLVEDSVFFTALLNEPADVEVSIGGNVNQNAVFTSVPEGEGPGIYEGSVSFAGNTGDVVVTVKRDGAVVAEAKGGAPISADCEVMNWNAVAVSS